MRLDHLEYTGAFNVPHITLMNTMSHYLGDVVFYSFKFIHFWQKNLVLILMFLRKK